jgi:hypothetical protein
MENHPLITKEMLTAALADLLEQGGPQVLDIVKRLKSAEAQNTKARIRRMRTKVPGPIQPADAWVPEMVIVYAKDPQGTKKHPLYLTQTLTPDAAERLLAEGEWFDTPAKISWEEVEVKAPSKAKAAA